MKSLDNTTTQIIIVIIFVIFICLLVALLSSDKVNIQARLKNDPCIDTRMENMTYAQIKYCEKEYQNGTRN